VPLAGYLLAAGTAEKP